MLRYPEDVQYIQANFEYRTWPDDDENSDELFSNIFTSCCKVNGHTEYGVVYELAHLLHSGKTFDEIGRMMFASFPKDQGGAL